MRRFKHLSKSDRIRIETLNNDGKTPKEIAEVVGVHISTIYRELQRGQYTHRNSDWTEEARYSSDLGEMKYRANLAAKGADLKIGNDHRLAEYIETKIADEKYSPEAVLGEIKAQGSSSTQRSRAKTPFTVISRRGSSSDSQTKISRLKETRNAATTRYRLRSVRRRVKA